MVIKLTAAAQVPRTPASSAIFVLGRPGRSWAPVLSGVTRSPNQAASLEPAYSHELRGHGYGSRCRACSDLLERIDDHLCGTYCTDAQCRYDAYVKATDTADEWRDPVGE